MQIEFEEIGHQYFLTEGSVKRLQVPSVTTLLDDVGLWPDFSLVSSYYRDLGTAGHKAIYHIFDAVMNRIDPRLGVDAHKQIIAAYIDDQDRDLQGYLKSFESWRTDPFHKIQTKLFEHRVASMELRAAGMLDWYGIMTFRDNARLLHMETLADFKLGAHHWQYGLQTAGYKTLLGHRVGRRFCICLQKDGSRPKLIPHDNFAEETTFRAAVSVYHAKRRRLL